MAETRRRTGDFLLSPVFLTALVVLLLNDFVIKRFFPGVVSGKLSDVAGPVVAALVVVAIAEMVVKWSKPAAWARVWWFALASSLVVLALGAVKLTEAGASVYSTVNEWVLARLADAGTAFGWSGSDPRVAVVPDAMDAVIALAAIPLVVWVGLRWRSDRVIVARST